MIEDHGSEIERLERALETIDHDRRDSMRKLIGGAAFLAPIVASFAINGMTTSAAWANNSYPNNSNHPYPNNSYHFS